MESVEASRILPMKGPNPALRGFGFLVPAAKVRFDVALEPLALTYLAFPLGAKERLPELKDYVYVGGEEGPEGYWRFNFLPPFTDTMRNTPYRSWETTKPFTWPEVLLAVEFLEDPAFPMRVPATASYDQTTNLWSYSTTPKFEPRVFTRMRMKPTWSGETRVEIRQYVSDRPWPGAAVVGAQPVPGVVSWDFFGAQDQRRCLHPDIAIRERQINARKMSGMGTKAAVRDRMGRGQFFKATEVEDWEPFTIVEQAPVGWWWFKEEATFYPPDVEEQTT